MDSAVPGVCGRPCANCPWRRDAEGRIAFSNLVEYAASTIPGRPEFVGPFGELFACHMVKTEPGMLCAGWFAIVGHSHPTVRLGLGLGVYPTGALDVRAGWPALFGSFEEMVATARGGTQ